MCDISFHFLSLLQSLGPTGMKIVRDRIKFHVFHVFHVNAALIFEASRGERYSAILHDAARMFHDVTQSRVFAQVYCTRCFVCAVVFYKPR